VNTNRLEAMSPGLSELLILYARSATGAVCAAMLLGGTTTAESPRRANENCRLKTLQVADEVLARRAERKRFP
jgi:hypothetical protein